MFKRLGLIALLTATGHVGSIVAIKLTSGLLPLEEMGLIAQVDALIFFTVNIIALGLQAAAIRNIALSNEWVSEYKRTQSARLILGFILFFFGLLAILKPEYVVFFLAPLIALSGDYALYAVSQPVKGALIACFRLLVPYGVLVAAAYFNAGLATNAFIIAWAAVYLITDAIIARFLGVNLFIKPRPGDLSLYLKSLPLGAVSLSFYFLGTGLVLVVPYFYPPAVETIAFVGLKFYTVYKGVLRIIHQAFLKEMMQDEWCLRVDQLSMLLSVVFLGSILFFPNSFITLIFGERFINQKNFFIILALSTVVYSFVLSAATKAMLEKKDKPYAATTIIAASMAIISTIILSFFHSYPTAIGISIFWGEMILLIGLIVLFPTKNLALPRLLFLVSASSFLLIPFLARYIVTDRLEWYLLSTIALTFALFLKNRKKFSWTR